MIKTQEIILFLIIFFFFISVLGNFSFFFLRKNKKWISQIEILVPDLIKNMNFQNIKNSLISLPFGKNQFLYFLCFSVFLLDRGLPFFISKKSFLRLLEKEEIVKKIPPEHLKKCRIISYIRMIELGSFFGFIITTLLYQFLYR
jgi:hypothetical protein